MVGLLFFSLPRVAASPIVVQEPQSAYTPILESERITDYTLERIGWCESRNDPNAQNPTSSAKGRFQFLDSSWKYYGYKLWGSRLSEKDQYSYADSTELAYFVVTLNGYKDWSSSKECWTIHLSPE